MNHARAKSPVDEDSSVTKLRQRPRWSLHLTSYGATVGSSSRVASIPEGLESGDCSMTARGESVDPDTRLCSIPIGAGALVVVTP